MMDRFVILKRRGNLITNPPTSPKDGSFGNEGYEAHIYMLAALEVTKGGAAKAKAKPAKAPAKRHRQSVDREDTSEEGAGEEAKAGQEGR